MYFAWTASTFRFVRGSTQSSRRSTVSGRITSWYFAPLEGVADEVRHAPDEADDLAVVHVSSVPGGALTVDVQITMRSISSTVTVSAVRSYSFVVLGDACPAICWACSRVPPFDRYAVTPVARNVWQQVEGGGPPRRAAA